MNEMRWKHLFFNDERMFLEISSLPSDFERRPFFPLCGGLQTAHFGIQLKRNIRAIISHLPLILFGSNISTGRMASFESGSKRLNLQGRFGFFKKNFHPSLLSQICLLPRIGFDIFFGSFYCTQRP